MTLVGALVGDAHRRPRALRARRRRGRRVLRAAVAAAEAVATPWPSPRSRPSSPCWSHRTRRPACPSSSPPLAAVSWRAPTATRRRRTAAGEARDPRAEPDDLDRCSLASALAFALKYARLRRAGTAGSTAPRTSPDHLGAARRPAGRAGRGPDLHRRGGALVIDARAAAVAVAVVALLLRAPFIVVVVLAAAAAAAAARPRLGRPLALSRTPRSSRRDALIHGRGPAAR